MTVAVRNNEYRKLTEKAFEINELDGMAQIATVSWSGARSSFRGVARAFVRWRRYRSSTPRLRNPQSNARPAVSNSFLSASSQSS